MAKGWLDKIDDATGLKCGMCGMVLKRDDYDDADEMLDEAEQHLRHYRRDNPDAQFHILKEDD